MRLARPMAFGLLGIALAGEAFAATQVSTEFAPFVGGGTTSGAQITAVSGAALALEHPFTVSEGGLQLSPRLELIDSQIDTKTRQSGATTLGSYDNHIIALGLKLSGLVGAAGLVPGQRAYTSLMLGSSFSTLNLDTDRETAADRSHYDQIRGTYASFEAGTYAPIKERFGLTLALVSSLYQQRQNEASGSYGEDSITRSGQLALGPVGPSSGAAALPSQVYLRTFAVKLGVTVQF